MSISGPKMKDLTGLLAFLRDQRTLRSLEEAQEQRVSCVFCESRKSVKGDWFGILSSFIHSFSNY